MNTFWSGTASIEITPKDPINMGGFRQRAQKASQGVHDPLYAKALFMLTEDRKLLWICADLIFIPNGLAAQVITQLSTSGLGLLPQEIIVCASHTHSGPDVMEYFEQTQAVKEYFQFLSGALVDVGRRAMADSVPARLRTGVGRIDFLVNRRTKGDPDVVDDRVFALLVESIPPAQSKNLVRPRRIAALFGVGCHPVTLGHDNFLISADYPGVAQLSLEQRLGVENAIFFNMAGGNIIPDTCELSNSLDPRGYVGGTYQDTQKIGFQLADEVVRILETSPAQSEVKLGSSRMEIFVRPSRYELDQAGAMQLLKDSQSVIAEYLGDEFTQFTPDNPGSFDTLWADATRQVVEQDLSESEVVRLMSAVCNYFVMTHKLFNPQQKADISLVVQVSAINEFRFLALPGEVLVEVGLDWKARHLTVERQAFIVGLANGFVGYLPHPSNFNELGAYQMIETLMNALEPAAIGQALKESEAISRKLLT